MQQKRLLQPEMMVMMTIKMKTMTIKMVKLLVERVGRTVHSVNLRVHTSRRQRELTPQLVGSDDCGDYLDFDDGSSLVRRLNFGGVPTPCFVHLCRTNIQGILSFLRFLVSRQKRDIADNLDVQILMMMIITITMMTMMNMTIEPTEQWLLAQ